MIAVNIAEPAACLGRFAIQHKSAWQLVAARIAG